MKEGRDVSIAERAQGESKVKRYLRYGIITVCLIFFAAVIIGAVVRRFGG